MDEEVEKGLKARSIIPLSSPAVALADLEDMAIPQRRRRAPYQPGAKPQEWMRRLKKG